MIYPSRVACLAVVSKVKQKYASANQETPVKETTAPHSPAQRILPTHASSSQAAQENINYAPHCTYAGCKAWLKTCFQKQTLKCLQSPLEGKFCSATKMVPLLCLCGFEGGILQTNKERVSKQVPVSPDSTTMTTKPIINNEAAKCTPLVWKAPSQQRA